MSESIKANEKRDILAKVHSALILSLGDKVLRENEKTAADSHMGKTRTPLYDQVSCK